MTNAFPPVAFAVAFRIAVGFPFNHQHCSAMPRPWISILTQFHDTPIFSRIYGTVAAVTLYAAIVECIDQYYLHSVETVGAEFHGFLGLILGTLLGR